MADTMTGTIAAAMTECEAAAREQGWEGDWHPLPADLEYGADQVKAAHGRYPTVAEWEDAGYKVFPNGAYCADETTTAAVALGRRGGARATEAQKAAARENAKRGGRPRVYRYALYRTQFHGGGLLSRHHTLEAAEAARRRWVGKTDCVCGCAVIVDRTTDTDPAPAYEGGSPYRAAS